MKSFPKILIAFFLIVFILQLGLLLFLALAPRPGQAADIQFKPQVIQDLGYTFNASDKTTGNIANLVKAIYKYAIGIVGILAAVVLMIGGVIWIMAGGSATAIGEAKAWIGASLTGLTLALLSYLILATINPALVNFQTTGIQQVEKKPPLSATEIENKCDKECSNYGYQYDPATDRCECYGSGSHKEWVAEKNLNGETVYKCAEINFPGNDTCNTDIASQTVPPVNCCRCVYGGFRIGVHDRCFSRLNMTSGECVKECGTSFFYTTYPNFTSNSQCDDSDNCIAIVNR